MVAILRIAAALVCLGIGTLRAAEFINTAPAASSEHKVIGEVLEFGTFDFKGPVTRQKNKATPDRATLNAPDTEFTRLTDAIELRPGVRFGFRFRIYNLPDQKEAVFHTIVRHPSMRLPSGKTRDHYEKETRLPVIDGKVQETTGYSLDQPFEQVPGRWTFEHWYHGQHVVAQNFTVLSAKEELERLRLQSTTGRLPLWVSDGIGGLPHSLNLAIVLANSPSENPDMEGQQMRARYRSFAFGEHRYIFNPEDAAMWKAALLENEAAGVYGRMIAAGYLLRVNEAKARQFLETQVHSFYRRYNHGAAFVLARELDNKPDDTWIQDQLIELIQDERLLIQGEQDDFRYSAFSQENDEMDRQPVDFDIVCYALGSAHCHRAVPALLRWIDTEQRRDVLNALGEIGDESVTPELVKRLEGNGVRNIPILEALAKLHFQPAATMMIQSLEAQLPLGPDKQFAFDRYLYALQELKAKEAIPVIKAWEAEPKSPYRPLARRVLAHLENPDPVPALLALLAKEDDKFDLIYDLARTRSRRAFQPIVEAIRTSPSTDVRRAGFYGLGILGSDESLRALVEFASEPLPGWEDWMGENQQLIIADSLAIATKQHFGRDFAAWEKWLREHPGFPALAD